MERSRARPSQAIRDTERALEMIKGTCHCGNVKFSISEDPKWLTSCNCSICRRLGALWGHVEAENVVIDAQDDATISYVHGDKTLAIHTCRNCGCTTHWENLKMDEYTRMAVNFRMCSDEDISKFRVRRFDGADTWKFFD